MKRPKPPKRRVTLVCVTCKDNPEFVLVDGKPCPDGLKAVRAHLRVVHKLKGPLKGKMRLTMALDGDGYYSNTFAATIGGVKLVKIDSGPSLLAMRKRGKLV